MLLSKARKEGKGGNGKWNLVKIPENSRNEGWQVCRKAKERRRDYRGKEKKGHFKAGRQVGEQVDRVLISGKDVWLIWFMSLLADWHGKAGQVKIGPVVSCCSCYCSALILSSPQPPLFLRGYVQTWWTRSLPYPVCDSPFLSVPLRLFSSTEAGGQHCLL